MNEWSHVGVAVLCDGGVTLCVSWCSCCAAVECGSLGIAAGFAVLRFYSSTVEWLESDKVASIESGDSLSLSLSLSVCVRAHVCVWSSAQDMHLKAFGENARRLKGVHDKINTRQDNANSSRGDGTDERCALLYSLASYVVLVVPIVARKTEVNQVVK